jgi:hypothetical protein
VSHCARRLRGCCDTPRMDRGGQGMNPGMHVADPGRLGIPTNTWTT